MSEQDTAREAAFEAWGATEEGFETDLYRSAFEAGVAYGRAAAFSRGELGLLYEMIDQRQQQAERELGTDDGSHAFRRQLRDKLIQLIYEVERLRAAPDSAP